MADLTKAHDGSLMITLSAEQGHHLALDLRKVPDTGLSTVGRWIRERLDQELVYKDQTPRGKRDKPAPDEWYPMPTRLGVCFCGSADNAGHQSGTGPICGRGAE